MLLFIAHLSNVLILNIVYFKTMKNYFIILSLFLFASANAYTVHYTGGIPTSTTYNPTYPTGYNTYHPYSSYRYFTPIRTRNYYNRETIRKINKINRIRNNIRRNVYNFLTWDNSSKGNLTGYSIPISSDVYKNLDFNSNDNIQKPISKNDMIEIFKMPSNNGMYYRNGELITDDSEIQGSAGVRIIYD